MIILDKSNKFDFYEHLIHSWGADPQIIYDRRVKSQEEKVKLSAVGLGLGETIKWARQDIRPGSRELNLLWVGDLKFVLLYTCPTSRSNDEVKRQTVDEQGIHCLPLPPRVVQELETIQTPPYLPRSPCKLLQFNWRSPDDVYLKPYPDLLKNLGIGTLTSPEEVYQELCEALAPKPKNSSIPTECLIASKGFDKNSFRNTKGDTK